MQFDPELSKLGMTQRFWRKVIHCKQGIFEDKLRLDRMSSCLNLKFYESSSFVAYLEHLKPSK